MLIIISFIILVFLIFIIYPNIFNTGNILSKEEWSFAISPKGNINDYEIRDEAGSLNSDSTEYKKVAEFFGGTPYKNISLDSRKNIINARNDNGSYFYLPIGWYILKAGDEVLVIPTSKNQDKTAISFKRVDISGYKNFSEFAKSVKNHFQLPDYNIATFSISDKNTNKEVYNVSIYSYEGDKDNVSKYSFVATPENFEKYKNFFGLFYKNRPLRPTL